MIATSFVLYGTQGIGKSRSALKIANLLGCENVLDDWNGRDTVPDNALAITNGSHTLNAGAIGFTVADTAGLEALVTLLERQAA